MRSAGLEFRSLTESERDQIFQGSLSNDLHVSKDGARALGTFLADRFLDWLPEADRKAGKP